MKDLPTILKEMKEIRGQLDGIIMETVRNIRYDDKGKKTDIIQSVVREVEDKVYEILKDAGNCIPLESALGYLDELISCYRTSIADIGTQNKAIGEKNETDDKKLAPQQKGALIAIEEIQKTIYERLTKKAELLRHYLENFDPEPYIKMQEEEMEAALVDAEKCVKSIKCLKKAKEELGGYLADLSNVNNIEAIIDWMLSPKCDDTNLKADFIKCVPEWDNPSHVDNQTKIAEFFSKKLLEYQKEYNSCKDKIKIASKKYTQMKSAAEYKRKSTVVANTNTTVNPQRTTNVTGQNTAVNPQRTTTATGQNTDGNTQGTITASSPNTDANTQGTTTATSQNTDPLMNIAARLEKLEIDRMSEREIREEAYKKVLEDRGARSRRRIFHPLLALRAMFSKDFIEEYKSGRIENAKRSGIVTYKASKEEIENAMEAYERGAITKAECIFTEIRGQTTDEPVVSIAIEGYADRNANGIIDVMLDR